MRANPGFTASVSVFAAQMCEKFRQLQGNGMGFVSRQHLAVLEAFSGYVRGCPDDDPGIVGLWRASLVMGHKSYEPGPRQRRVLELAGQIKLGDEPLPTAVLADLVGAAIEDVQAFIEAPVQQYQRERDQAAKALRRLEDTTVDRSLVRALQDQLVAANEQNRPLALENHELRRRLAAVEPGQDHRDLPQEPSTSGSAEASGDSGETVPGGTVAAGGDISPPERDDRLPTGIRQRGAGFQAFWRDRDGRQQQRGGFATVEEAVAHREAALSETAGAS